MSSARSFKRFCVKQIVFENIIWTSRFGNNTRGKSREEKRVSGRWEKFAESLAFQHRAHSLRDKSSGKSRLHGTA